MMTGRLFAAPLAVAVLVLGGGNWMAHAAITVVNTDSLRTISSQTSFTKSFNAGAADKLVVSACYEGGPSHASLTVTYNGVAMTAVPGTFGNRNEGMWYLDDPHTGGAADIVIIGDGVTTFGSMGMGIVSIAGSADGYDVALHSAGSSNVTLNVSEDGSFVFANIAANNGGIPTAVAPLTQLYSGALNSSEGAAAYQNGVSSGSQTFTFTSGTAFVSPETSAAAFSPGPAAVTPGFDFLSDAGQDTDGDARWEDVVAGNPSGLELLLDTASGVGRVAATSSTRLTHAYDFPGEQTGEQVAGAALITTGGGAADDASFQDASNPSDWSTRDVTIEVWFRPDNLTPSAANGQIIFEDGGGSGLGLFLENNELICGQDGNTHLISYNISTDPSGLLLGAATNEFIQAVVTRTAAGATILYVNGSSVGTASDDDSDWSGGDPAAFGTRGGSNTGGRGGGQLGESFDGEIALIRVYAAEVLNEYQIRDNYVALTAPDTIAPTISALSPADDETDVLVDTDLVATFGETVELTGSGTIVVTNLDDNTGLTIDLSSLPTPDANVTASGRDLTIVLTNDLAAGTNYAVRISTNAVVDPSTNYFAGITNNTTWNFTTAPPDDTPPVITNTVPADDATDVPHFSDLTAQFDDRIITGTGTITVYNVTLGSTEQLIDVTDGAQISISDNTLTIDPATDLDVATEYAVQMDAGAIRNVAGLDHAGITDTTTWSFTTVPVATYTWIQGGDPDNLEDPLNWEGGAVAPRDQAGVKVVFGPNTTGQIAGDPPNGKITFGSLVWGTGFQLRDLGHYTDYNSGMFVDSGTTNPATATVSGGAHLLAYYVNWTLNSHLELSGSGKLTVRAYNSRGVEGPGGFIVGSGIEVEFDATHGGHDYTYTGGVIVRDGGLVDLDSRNGALGNGPVTVEEGGLIQLHNSTMDNDTLFDLNSSGSDVALMTGGTVTFSGEFSFDLKDAADTEGQSWKIVGVTTPTYDAGFSVADATESGDVWAGKTQGILYPVEFEFDETTGILAVTKISPTATVLVVR